MTLILFHSVLMHTKQDSRLKFKLLLQKQSFQKSWIKHRFPARFWQIKFTIVECCIHWSNEKNISLWFYFLKVTNIIVWKKIVLHGVLKCINLTRLMLLQRELFIPVWTSASLGPHFPRHFPISVPIDIKYCNLQSHLCWALLQSHSCMQVNWKFLILSWKS